MQITLDQTELVTDLNSPTFPIITGSLSTDPPSMGFSEFMLLGIYQ
jgi:hypothetical protein